jgi:urea transport system ATP-binding protein
MDDSSMPVNGHSGYERQHGAVVDRAVPQAPVQGVAGRVGQRSAGPAVQRQQLAIARVLITTPTLLLLDEPTEGIQPTVVAEIERTILTLAARRPVRVTMSR